MNHLPADDSHKMSSLIFLESYAMLHYLLSAAIMIGILRVNLQKNVGEFKLPISQLLSWHSKQKALKSLRVGKEFSNSRNKTRTDMLKF